MKITKAAGLITASVIAFSSLSSITAGAVTFTEDEKGVKTWTFKVNDKYPEGVTVDDKKDAYFSSGCTYYASNGYTTDKPEDLNNYLTLTVKNDEKTIESNKYSTIFLNHAKNITSSELTYTAPADGTVSLTAGNNGDVYLKVNGDTKGTANTDYTETVTAPVEQGDTITISAASWAGAKQVIFTPDQYTALYEFTQKASEMNGKTLVVTTSDDTKKSTTINTSDGTYFTGDGDVELGIIINNIPNNVTIESVVIE